MAVSVVVPFRGGCPHRERALEWVLSRYAEQHPGWELVVAEAPAGPWCKAAAVMPAVERSSADIVVVADADVWCDGIGEAVAETEAGAAWTIPHLILQRLSEKATAALIAGTDPDPADVAERPYKGIRGGGIVVTHRAVIQSVPMDPRFVGWGQEDMSWALALDTLAGAPWRGKAPLLHLWHPPQPRMTRRRGNPDGWRLFKRYAVAKRDPNEMRSLLNEIGGPHGVEHRPDPHQGSDHGRRRTVVGR